MVTDHGKPLWRVSPAEGLQDDVRAGQIDAELDSLLAELDDLSAETTSGNSLAAIVNQSRR